RRKLCRKPSQIPGILRNTSTRTYLDASWQIRTITAKLSEALLMKNMPEAVIALLFANLLLQFQA
ncbi:MAG: hypothetical protein LBD81_03590, partial [Holosporaceae bacterium]|nr:hypothetical protein [Holosporaceae bacterium]